MEVLQEYYSQFDTCREREIPMCADACPFRVDFLEIQDRITKKRFNAAYKTLRDKTVFPGIVSKICPGFCEKACIKSAVDSPVQIRSLERSLIAAASRKRPNSYNLPARPKRIAVIGAGLSGMGFALKMAARKYSVTVFEKGDRMGGRLAELLPYEEYFAEFDLQFSNEKFELKLSVEVTDLTDLCTGPEAFDVVFVATGTDGEAFGLNYGGADDPCAMFGDCAVFLGGRLVGLDDVSGLALSIRVSDAAENFLQTGKLEYPAPLQPTRCVVDEAKLECSAPLQSNGCVVDDNQTAAGNPDAPAETLHDVLTEDECVSEASRCIRCQCDACETNCDLIRFYKKWPVKMRDEIYLSCKPAGSLAHKCPARKYIAACTECDLMENSCPDSIPLCSMIKYARHKMHENNKVPAAYKQFFIRDMEHANGELAAVCKAAPPVKCEQPDGGSTHSLKPAPACSQDGISTHPQGEARYAFFPGCNLATIDPDYVLKPYRWLLDKMPDTGLLLRCCGIPADWSGNRSAHDEQIASLKSDWESLGKPTLITACISCQKHLNEYLPEAEVISLYEVMAEYAGEFAETAGITGASPTHAGASPIDDTLGQSFCIFDPCSARTYDSVRESVRKLVAAAGIKYEELPHGGNKGCCGFGGNGSMADPDFAKYVAQERTSMSDNPYIVYCTNCKDIFAGEGKPVKHILDLLFGISSDSPLPDVSQRRVNRTILKEQLLKEFWNENMENKPNNIFYELLMDDDVSAKANHQRILAEDICNVIEHAERTGRRTRNPKTGHYKAYNEIGAITLWVEYSEGDPEPLPEGPEHLPEDSAHLPVRRIHNVYTHRMQIQLEAVFNGKKIDE